MTSRKPSWSVVVLLLSSCTLFAQQPAAKSSAHKAPKLCVFGIGNGSMKGIQVNEVQEELVRQLLAAGLNADEASSSTLVAKRLELSGNNKESIHLRKCAYALLTAVDSGKSGGSSTGASGAVSEGELLLSFALYKTAVAKPLVDTSIPAPAADAPTQAILKVIDKEVEQVRESLSKK